ncbi:MAG TPA: NosD domain-containing protein, partial [Candidatus Limnocylindrales bacterium]|nr:NosD domain-containing protein [Candidatus Limnocylindrales bacterium]
EGNRFGVDSLGSGIVPNAVAVHAGASVDVTVTGNLIQGNNQGMQISAGASGTVVTDNSIVGNTTGILIAAATNTSIGGPGSLANVIATNTNDGIALSSLAPTGIDIEGNSIYANGDLGIDLGEDGVTANDAGDADSGANGLQNYPIVASVVHGVGTTVVTGSLNSQPSTTYRLDFFASAACDPSGNGEGEVFLGSTSVGTDASGDVAFTTPPLAASNDGDVITATATDPSGSTSEFSACGTTEAQSFVVNTTDDTDDGLCGTLHCSLREAINRANAESGTNTISFDIDPGGQQTIGLTATLPTIIDPVLIDGTTQPGYLTAPLIEIDGAGAGDGVSGLTLGTGSDGSTIRALAVNGFAADGVRIFSDGAVVEGSYIGLGLDGATGRGNGDMGIAVLGASDTRIGTGADVGTGNVISGNGQHGISVSGGSPTGPVLGTVIGGNLIGTDAAGTAAIGNADYAIFLNQYTQNALVGGPTAAQRNVLSGNTFGYVSASGASGNVVEGNYIGTDVSGSAAIPNAVGVILTASDAETIRGNVISGNTEEGVRVAGNPDLEDFANGNVIVGNRIGTDASGTLDLGNGGDGIHIRDTTDNNVIGGDTTLTPELANVISGNGGNGVNLGVSSGNLIQGNLIGTDVSGTLPIGNDLAGVRITGPSSMNQVGASHVGTTISGPGNTIAFNGGNGVELLAIDGDADFTSILSNAIHDNGGLGIDLEADGVTPNDPLDADDGSNDLKNFPDVVSGTSDGFTTVGTIGSDSSAPSEIIVYQLYANDDCDASGNGEGQRLVATIETAADETGTARANFSVDEDLSGLWLTATTSDNQGQTSEFSACSLVDFGDGATEIRLLNASLPLEPTQLLVPDGDDPYWAADGVLYTIGGDVHRIQPDASGDEAVTDDTAGDEQPAAGAGVVAFVRAPGSDAEVFVLRSGGSVNVTASDEIPGDLRLDLYYACGGEILPIAVGITPDQTGATTASFVVNFDASLSCAGGEILAALTDGFLRTVTPPGSGEQVTSEDKPPVAATYGPPQGETYLTSAVIPFHGAGEDADDGALTGPSLAWFIRPSGDPCCGSQVGTGASVDYDASQLAPGDYIVTLVTRDSSGQTDAAESLIHVVADADHDGFSDADETGTCFGTGAATDGSTPSGDADADGIPNGSDPEPCVARSVFNAVVNFDPDALNLTSEGTGITVTVSVPGRDLKQITGSTVRIVAVGSEPATFNNVGWIVKKGVGTAKFSRAALVSFLADHGIENMRVSITVAGSSSTNPAWSFEGRDSTFVKR